LILAWHNSTAIAKVSQLQSLGFKVYWNDPATLAGVSKSMVDIGHLLGAEQAGAQSAIFDQTLRDLRTTYAHKPPVSVFYQVWNEPLQTLNGEHLISDVMAVCGGINVFSDVSVRAPKISVEALLRANPQVIIASGMGEARPEWLDEWRNWPQLQAYQHQQLHFIPPQLLQRHTPRVLQGATMMCQQLEQARLAYAQDE
jgi:iron complex transport system substrate-binding protein